jgi:hypothetical protein
MSSQRVQPKAGSYSPRLVVALCIFIFVIAGCALKLFEYPTQTKELSQVKAKITDTKVIGLVEVLERRSKPKLEEITISGSKRLIRRDLQNFIDAEWERGWEYLQSMDLKTFASNIEGNDGILVPKEALRRFDPDDSIDSIRRSQPGVKLSFIHLSDAQLRDERVYMFTKELTGLLDYISDGFDHEPDLVFYDYSYYLTQIGIMRQIQNRLPAAERPSFMIHTGDALHMGVVSELYEFIYITNKLRIPWYDALGNHDYQVYGNLSSKDVGVIDPTMGFQTVSSRYNFINMHGKGFAVDKQVYFSPDNAPDDNTTLLTRSVYNGFDRKGNTFLEQGKLRDRLNKACKHCPGYYHFEALEPKEDDPGILVVVLDTSTKDFRFAKGTVYRHKEVVGPPDESRRLEQINWLRGVLEEYAAKGNWMVLTFGHHALNGKNFFDDSYEKVTELFHNPRYNVVAYFCGHSHEHLVAYHKNPHHAETFGFWEIKTNAIMEYPKKGSLVNIRWTDEGYWEITVQSFWPYFLEDLPADAPAMLKNAQKCFEAAKSDMEGKKKLLRYSKLDPKHHDVVLRFSFPKGK